MKIVGVGAGPNLLTEEAISAIESAEIIFGSKRAIELAREHKKCETHEITDYKLDSLPENAVVLSTGDPMLSGLGKFAKKYDEVIPGISSLQLACSRLCLDMDNLSVITAHSGESIIVEKRIVEQLREGRKLFILPGRDFGVKEIADVMKSRGLSRKISVCERLAYPDERIVTGTTEEPPSVSSSLYCIVISG
ncbi:MAG: cobalt-precorrin-7 (C(5))-methyltransferase [Candidatus Methanoperedens sp.]|nr:cobalt-precorrin-7 (C(5))-methyltransferase [Candidatus Methanoperedens sp.]MCZ7369195.1 cobalt-precorrin-7 (C(5))-methyltransferase [Candidatus Methanoperedens sp.]